MIRGPITGGAHEWAFGRPLFDLAAHGYVEAEYVLTGEATTYRRAPRTGWGRDGRWTAEAAGRAPFTTRMLVYRPADPVRFNHTAIVSWNNVTAGYELFQGESPEILQGGYAFVAASVQRVGVHGFPANNQGLAAWDPERYGSLSIPTDDASYDIFTQVARAVGPNRARGGVDPMAGLDVRKVIGIGASQSAGRLATYVNAVHPLERAYDGFLLQIYFGRGTPLEVGPATVNVDMTTPLGKPDPAALIRQTGLAGTNLIRDDLDVPVMVVNSELEAIACHGVRQPDTDRYRCWESAGTSHVSHAVSLVRAAKYQRDFGEPLPVLEHMNRIAITPLYDAAIHHLNRWVYGGAPPPSQPLVAFAGDPPEVQRDRFGIAVGGVRLPQADAPVATNSAVPLAGDLAHLLRGSCRPFDAETLDALYGDEATYLARFEEAARRAVRAGVLLARDVEPALEEAAREYRRVRGAQAQAAAQGAAMPDHKLNPRGRDVAVVVGATSKWQADGRNTRLAHGAVLDDSTVPVSARWGVGGAIAQKFAEAGFFVVMTTRAAANAAGLAQAIAEQGGAATVVEMDLASQASIAAAFEAIRRDAGDPAVLVYNAGYLEGRALPREQELLEFFPVEMFETALDIACRGPFLVAKEVLPAMRQNGRGTFLFSNNSESLRGRKRRTGASLYYPRVMMRALAQALTEEYSEHGVHVANVIIDGAIDSPGTRALPNIRADALIDPAKIAEAFYYLHVQDPSCWTHEIQLTPAVQRPSY